MESLGKLLAVTQRVQRPHETDDARPSVGKANSFVSSSQFAPCTTYTGLANSILLFQLCRGW